MQSAEPTVNDVNPPITNSALQRAAAEELVSVGAVLKVLSGLEVKGLAGERARRAVARLRNK